MAQLVAVDQKLLEDIFTSLKRLEKKVESLEPVYGSEAWWGKETKEALKEYKRGEGKSFDNIEDLIKDLHS